MKRHGGVLETYSTSKNLYSNLMKKTNWKRSRKLSRTENQSTSWLKKCLFTKIDWMRIKLAIPLFIQSFFLLGKTNRILKDEGVATPSQGVRDSRDSGLKIHGPYGWFSGKCTRFCTHFGLSCGPLAKRHHHGVHFSSSASVPIVDVKIFTASFLSIAIMWLC